MRSKEQSANDNNKPNTWLNDFARSVTSQGGEDGIIEKILDVISNTNKWCVEFGSWDGKKLSNTFNLIDKKDYSSVLIEGDTSKFQDLLKTFEGNKKITCINTLVGFEKDDCLDTILKNTEIPGYFYGPNTLESWVCRWCQNNSELLPNYLYFQKNCASAIQVNMVNTSTKNDFDSAAEYTVEALNERYKTGYGLDIDFVARNKPTATHCGVEFFKLTKSL